MSGLKHTPGPWNCFYKSKYDEWHVSVPSSHGSMKWALFDDGISSENPEADARLIAAAPEQHAVGLELERLSLVLESAVRHADPLHHAAVVSLIKANGAAIAKATGPRHEHLHPR